MSRSRSPRWILAVELPQLRVQRRMLALDLDRLLEERLRRDGEELGLVRRPVVVQRGPPRLSSNRHASAAILTFISSVTVSPPHPSKCFSVRKTCTRRSRRSRSSALNHRASGTSCSTTPYHESGIGPVGSRSDFTGMRRSTADTPRYDTTMRTKAATTTASPSIRSPPRDSLVPPTIEPLWQPLPRHDPRTRERGPEHAGAIVEPARPRIDLLPQLAHHRLAQKPSGVALVREQDDAPSE